MKYSILLLSLFFYFNSSSSAQLICTPMDSVIWTSMKQKKSATLNETWDAVATSFIGKPYVASTLEVTDNEDLVVNLREVDCTTFVEYALAISITLQNKPDATIKDFFATLEKIRYRDSIRNGYTSRLHYFSEWLKNNAKKGFIKEVNSTNFKPDNRTLSFMGTHRSAYTHLKSDANFAAILEVEKTFKPNMKVLNKSQITLAEDDLKHGDVIGLVTRIKGLDVSHTGFIYKKNGISYLLHASSLSMEVEISEVPLIDYLKKSKSTTGIVVYRMAG